MDGPTALRSGHPATLFKQKPMKGDLDWRTVFGSDDRAVLSAYARERAPYAGLRPALVVIDVTEAFVGPNTPVAQAQESSRQACGERAWAALPAINSLLETFRRLRRPIIFTAPDQAQRWVGAATRGASTAEETADTAFVDGIRPREDELTITKAKASIFFGTPLLSGLIQRGCDTIVLTGGTTSGCVRASAVDGTSLGFEVLIAEDGCFDRTALSHAVSLAEIDLKYGRVMPAGDISSFFVAGD
jgi:nicotinamidase-related amidase